MTLEEKLEKSSTSYALLVGAGLSYFGGALLLGHMFNHKNMAATPYAAGLFCITALCALGDKYLEPYIRYLTRTTQDSSASSLPIDARAPIVQQGNL